MVGWCEEWEFSDLGGKPGVVMRRRFFPACAELASIQ
jgi:hypothetical protein